MPGNFTVEMVTEIDKGLRFNVLYTFMGEDGLEYLCFGIPGFRFMNGCLYPPAACVKGRWHSTVLLYNKSAEGIYRALATKLGELGWSEIYKLGDMKTTVEPLIDIPKTKRSFPSLVGEL